MTGEELKTLRIQAGYSTNTFAEWLGLKGDRTLRRWEAGTRPIPEPMQRFLKAIRDNPDWHRLAVIEALQARDWVDKHYAK
jgi:DNA-binding transcriptional regulator YiaG